MQKFVSYSRLGCFLLCYCYISQDASWACILTCVLSLVSSPQFYTMFFKYSFPSYRLLFNNSIVAYFFNFSVCFVFSYSFRFIHRLISWFWSFLHLSFSLWVEIGFFLKWIQIFTCLLLRMLTTSGLRAVLDQLLPFQYSLAHFRERFLLQPKPLCFLCLKDSL